MEIIAILLVPAIFCLAIGLRAGNREGRRPDRPIRTRSVAGEYDFLSCLSDSRGAPVQALRRGVLYVPGFREVVDWWIVRKSDGTYTDLYLYGYGEAPEPEAPSGFRLDAKAFAEALASRDVRQEGPKPAFAGTKAVESCFSRWETEPNPPEFDRAATVKIGDAAVPPPDGFVPLAVCNEETRQQGVLEWSRRVSHGFRTDDFPAYIEKDETIQAGSLFVELDGNGDIAAMAMAYPSLGDHCLDESEHRAFQKAVKDSLFARGDPHHTFAPYRESDIELQWNARRDMGCYARGLLRAGGQSLGLAISPPVDFLGGPLSFWETRGIMSAWADKIRRANGLPAFDAGGQAIPVATTGE